MVGMYRLMNGQSVKFASRYGSAMSMSDWKSLDDLNVESKDGWW